MLDKIAASSYVCHMPTLTQCFSALIASGNGQLCNEFRNKIHERFLEIDPVSGKRKSYLFKYGETDFPERHKEMRLEMGKIISSVAENIDLAFFGKDL